MSDTLERLHDPDPGPIELEEVRDVPSLGFVLGLLILPVIALEAVLMVRWLW